MLVTLTVGSVVEVFLLGLCLGGVIAFGLYWLLMKDG